MAKPVHSMIRVLDEARSLDFYARAFGLEVADHLKFDDFALIYLRHPSSPFEVELTVNFDRDWSILSATARWGISATPAAGALPLLGETHGKYP